MIQLADTPGWPVRVLVGDSVYEHAAVTVYGSHLRIEFAADDLDPIDVDLGAFPRDE